MHKFCHFPKHFVMKLSESIVEEYMLKKRHENELFG
jgi:hypothetical protein